MAGQPLIATIRNRGGGNLVAGERDRRWVLRRVGNPWLLGHRHAPVRGMGSTRPPSAGPVRCAPYRTTVFTLGVCGPCDERRVDSCGEASRALVFCDRVVRPQPVAGTSGSAA